jgi:transcription termination/antitermination protein NusA
MSKEILILVDALSREKGVGAEATFIALEQALASAVKKHKFTEHDVDVRVSIDRETGEYEAFRRWQVLADELVITPDCQLAFSEAREQLPDVQLEEYVEEDIEGVEFGRIGAQAAKQVMMQRIRDAEREQVLADFQERGERIINGTVKRLDRGDAIIEIGRLEGRLARENMIPKENMRAGDRVRAYVTKIDPTARGPQLTLSRTSPEFLLALVTNEVPEIEQGLLVLKGAARDPGIRAKLAVFSTDAKRVDPIGTCVGVRGTRITAVRNEISGENVDIVLWNEEPSQFVVDALSPAQVKSIVIDEDAHSMDVVVDEENLAIAIGRGGQNVRLASELTGWRINLMTESESEQKQSEELENARASFVKELDVDAEVADILIEQGFTSLEEVAYVAVDELLAIESFDEDTVQELRRRARNAVLAQNSAREQAAASSGEGLLQLVGEDKFLLDALPRIGVYSPGDLATLASDELLAELAVSKGRLPPGLKGKSATHLLDRCKNEQLEQLAGLTMVRAGELISAARAMDEAAE